MTGFDSKNDRAWTTLKIPGSIGPLSKELRSTWKLHISTTLPSVPPGLYTPTFRLRLRQWSGSAFTQTHVTVQHGETIQSIPLKDFPSLPTRDWFTLSMAPVRIEGFQAVTLMMQDASTVHKHGLIVDSFGLVRVDEGGKGLGGWKVDGGHEVVVGVGGVGGVEKLGGGKVKESGDEGRIFVLGKKKKKGFGCGVLLGGATDAGDNSYRVRC
ncbi:hypothetical protein HDU97_010346 [Phlyctochytrium planicorne]|nr:hypothetical protein HDU97_010346 [Phlyctochytrium planicorne]